jgi:hypothetical protein
LSNGHGSRKNGETIIFADDLQGTKEIAKHREDEYGLTPEDYLGVEEEYLDYIEKTKRR